MLCADCCACPTYPMSLPGLSPSHGLFAAAGEDGLLECFDLRARSSIATLDAAAAAGAPGALALGCSRAVLRCKAQSLTIAGHGCSLPVSRYKLRWPCNCTLSSAAAAAAMPLSLAVPDCTPSVAADAGLVLLQAPS
jgi:hypothetical protein